MYIVGKYRSISPFRLMFVHSQSTGTVAVVEQVAAQEGLTLALILSL